MLTTTPSIARELIRIGNQCYEIAQDFKDQKCSKVLKQTKLDELIVKIQRMLEVEEDLIKSIDIDEENVSELAKELSKLDSEISKDILKVRESIEENAKQDLTNLRQYFILSSFVDHLKIISSESHSIGRSAKFIINGKTRRRI